MQKVKLYRIGLLPKEAKALAMLLGSSFALQALSSTFESGTDTEFKNEYGISKKDALALMDTLVKTLER